MLDAYSAGEAAVQDGLLACLVKLMEDEDNIEVFTENQKTFLGLLQVNNMVGNQNTLQRQQGSHYITISF